MIAGAPQPLRQPLDGETSVDPLIDAMLVAVEQAQLLLDNELPPAADPMDDYEAASPPIVQAVRDATGAEIAAIRLDRRPGSRFFDIVLLPAAPASEHPAPREGQEP